MPPDVDLDAVADVVVATLQTALAPVLAKLATLEIAVAGVDQLRERVAVVETKTHPPIDLTPLVERVAVLETRPPVPGPPGPPGANGADGKPGLTYQGIHLKGQPYVVGDVVTRGGSAWYCHTATTSTPGDDGSGWVLMVKHGRDAVGSP